MNYSNIQFDFEITHIGKLFEYESDKSATLDCTFDGENLLFSVLYSFNPDMLSMTAKASENDRITVKIFPFRIELYVNDRLCDEEWPCGQHFLENSNLCENQCNLSISQATPSLTKDLPRVLYTFENAEGWRPDENVFAGDCMPYIDDGRYHVIYLYDRHHHKSKWRKGAHQWAHISTADFKTWQAHPMMVEITEDWEGSICTGSHIRKGDIHYLFYTVRTCDGSPAPISRSISKDGYHFEKDLSYRFSLSEKYMSSDARDPKIIMGEDGLYHMLITTGLSDSGKGCLAHLVSADLDTWTEKDEPVYISPDDNQPECPDYFKLGKYHYLVFSHRSVGQYLYSEKPFSDWKVPNNPIVPCDSVPKGAVVGDKVIFAGYKGNGKYAGTMTFKTAFASKNGELVFE